MLWIITKDHINTGPDDVPSRVGWLKTGNAKDDREYDAAKKSGDVSWLNKLTKQWTKLCDHHFRLYDDDGELYYEGVCLGLDDADQDEAFEPLDWAANDAGCTKMTYRKVGTTEWKTL